jgi:hypothetical protein
LEHHGGLCVDENISERRIEYEDDFVPGSTGIDEAILDHSELNWIVDLESKFLTNLATEGVYSQFVELYRPSQRPEETLLLRIVEAGGRENTSSIVEDADGNVANV